MDPRKMVRLGRSDVSVSRLGVGLAPMIGHSGIVDDRTADAIIRQARLLGVRHIDVAPLYGLGRSEAAIERGVPRSDDVAITVSTKAGGRLVPRNLRNRILVRTRELRYADDRRQILADYRRYVVRRLEGRVPGRQAPLGPRVVPAGTGVPAPAVDRPDRVVVRDFSGRGVRRSAEESLKRMGRDRVEIMFLHDPDGLRGSALQAAWKPLIELREQGVVGAIGFSGNGTDSMTQILGELDPDVVMLAGRYTLLDQSAMDHVLPLAQKRGVAVILGGVFNGGLIADPGESDQFDHRPADDRHKHRAALIAEIGARHGVSAAAAGIQFAAAHPAVASVVVGVRSPGELVDDLRLAESTIDESFWGELISAGIIRADAPIPSDASLLEEAAG